MKEMYFVICLLFDGLEDLDCVLNLRKTITTIFVCALIEQKITNMKVRSAVYTYPVQRVFPF